MIQLLRVPVIDGFTDKSIIYWWNNGYEQWLMLVQLIRVYLQIFKLSLIIFFKYLAQLKKGGI